MNGTNVMVTEGKKVSDLPVSLGFSSSAVVLIVDNGRTAQMSLSALLQELVQLTKTDDNGLLKKIEDIEKKAAELEANCRNFETAYKSYQTGVANRFTAERKVLSGVIEDLEATRKVLDTVRYSEEAFGYDAMTLRSGTYSTDNAIVGTRYGYTRGEDGTGYFGCSMNAKKGSLLAFEGCQKINPLFYSKYLVVTDVDDYILELISVSDLVQDGYVYEFKQDGKFILSAHCDTENMDLPVFKIKKPAAGLPKASADDEGKILQVVNGNWKAVDSATAAVGNEVAY